MHEEFWAIPKSDLALEGLSLEARVLYGVLYTRRNGENIAWPGQEHLAATLQVGERSIRRYIEELKKAGLIRVEQQGLRRTNRYFLTGQLGHSRLDKAVRSRSATGGHSHSKRTGGREDRKSEGLTLSREDQEKLGFVLTN